MFKPISFYLGLRYLRAKQHRFLSFISLVSMIGIGLSITVLITVLSVMNGFDVEIHQRIFNLIPHLQIILPKNNALLWKDSTKDLSKTSGVIATAPYIQGQGILTKKTRMHPVLIKGILPQAEKNISVIQDKMISGSLDKLASTPFGIVIGMGLAMELGLREGDSVNLMIPEASITPVGVIPRLKIFTIVGVFDAGSGFGFNESCAFIHLRDAQKLYHLGANITGVQLKIKNLFQANNLAGELIKKMGFDYEIRTWSDQYGSFYHAVQMEKTMMFFILLLLMAIAVFNLVSSLVMLVNDKKSDIAILRTFGATPGLIQRIFIIQGLSVGIIGIILGVIFGVILALNITALVDWIQHTFHVSLLTAGVYFVDYLPSKLEIADIIHIIIIALILSFVATLYPARRAAKTDPVQALRYE